MSLVTTRLSYKFYNELKVTSTMQNKSIIALAAASLLSVNTVALEVNFSDSEWDGKTIPEGQQCQKFGGDSPSSPGLIVTGIPLGTNGIVLEFSDRDSKRMNKGGHGRVRFALSDWRSEVTIPSVPGHSFDIPSEFTIVEAHRGADWDKAGAYMPPCSGGRAHNYVLTIKSVKKDKTTAETDVKMGVY